MPAWTLVLCNGGGVPITDFEAPCTLRWEKSRGSIVRFPALNHADRETTLLLATLAEGLPQLRAYRRVAAEGAYGRLRHSGRWWPGAGDDATDEASTLGVEFRSALGGLDRRYLSAALTYTGQAQDDIVAGLLAHAEARSPTRIAIGTLDSNTVRDREYEAGNEIGAAIQQLVELDGGPVLVETPLDPREHAGNLGLLDVVSNQGTNLAGTLFFEYGPATVANCVAATRQWDLPVNRVTASGGTGTTPQVATDSASIAMFDEWEQQISFPDVTDDAVLLEHARAALRPLPVQSVTFTPDPGVAPDPWVDYWLGDTASFHADSDSLLIDTSAEIRAIEIELDENGLEVAHRIDFGDQRTVRPGDALRKLRHQIAALERA